MLSLGLGAIGVVVGRRLLGFLLRASTGIPGVRCCLGWIWLPLSPYGCFAFNRSALFFRPAAPGVAVPPWWRIPPLPPVCCAAPALRLPWRNDKSQHQWLFI